jgi:hypothetical protein
MISKTIKRASSNIAKMGLLRLFSRSRKKIRVNELIRIPCNTFFMTNPLIK